MWRSLRFRIILAMVVVSTLGIAITALLASRTTANLFEEFAGRHVGPREAPMIRILVDHFRANQGWTKVQPLVENLGQTTNDRVILANADGQIVGDSDTSLLGKVMVDDFPPSFFAIMVGKVMVGKLYIDPFKLREVENDAFIGQINRTVLIGAGGVILVALAVTSLISRTMIRPVEQLTTAVQRMEKGDMAARVNIRSTSEVGRLARAFNQMAESLAHLEQLRRNMVSDVAHELRTPLTNIRGYLEAVRDGLMQADTKLVDNLYEEAMLLNRLVDDLQELSLAEAGHLNLERQVQEIEPLVHTAVELSRPQANERKLELIEDIQPGLSPISVDDHRIIQVLRNLINNAIDYSPVGEQIKVSARGEDAGIHISVADAGPGIAPEQLSMVFERFYRADSSRARSSGGAGLGLAIVRQLVELHGGRVWAESEPGRGAVFHVQLPAIPSSITLP